MNDNGILHFCCLEVYKMYPIYEYALSPDLKGKKLLNTLIPYLIKTFKMSIYYKLLHISKTKYLQLKHKG